MAGRATSEIDRRIAHRIVAARHDAGLSQKECGEWLGVSATQFQKYELGTNRISAGMLQVLAGRLGQPVDTFFDAPAPGCKRRPRANGAVPASHSRAASRDHHGEAR